MTEIEVRGGVGGVEVRYDELARAAAVLREEGLDLLALAADRHRLLVDDDLLASAALHPMGFARVEGALLAALDGPSGLAAAGGRLEVRAVQLLAAVAQYRAAEAVTAEAVEARRWLLGASAPWVGPVAVGVGSAWAASVVARGGDPVTELEQALVEHPGVVDEVAGSVGGLTARARGGLLGPLPVLADQAFRAVTGQALLPRDLEESAGLLALLYAPGRPELVARRDDSATGTLVPGGVGDLLRRLHHRNEQAAVGAGRQGDIGVTRVVSTTEEGATHVAWVVDIPGTKEWQVVPGPRPALNDLATNLELIAGVESGRVEALRQILDAAGADVHDPVLLVGHSQGGMLAMRAADALAGSFNVTHVVTAGSPTGGMPAPPGVQVLSLENRHDVVPRTDGRDNDDPARHVTVLFDHQTGTVAGNHGMQTAYLPAARAVDESADTSVRVWLEAADAFLAAPGERTSATTTVYTVTNDQDGDGS